MSDTVNWSDKQYNALCGTSLTCITVYLIAFLALTYNLKTYLLPGNRYHDLYISWFYLSAYAITICREIAFVQIAASDCSYELPATWLYRVCDILAMYFNFMMGLGLAFTQYEAVFPLIEVRNLMSSSRDSASLTIWNKLTKCAVYLFGAVVGIGGTICWALILILQFTESTSSWTNTHEGYIFSVFFLAVALLMISGTIIINYLMRYYFSHKIQERKDFLFVFITIAIIMFFQSLWLFIFYLVVLNTIRNDDTKNNEVEYEQYMVESYFNMVWDVPTILMVCWLHH
jgi:hypothetical protein